MFGERKRTFKELQKEILNVLKSKDATVNDIRLKTGIHPYVIEHQLVLLRGKGYVDLMFSHGKFKLFSVSKLGKGYFKKLK